jgi:hypothetical protein
MSLGRRSVYRVLLGERADALHPRLAHYVDGIDRGEAGVGRGLYDFAGPTRRWLSPIFALFAPGHALFGERARDVGLTVINVPHRDGRGRVCLSSTRRFEFAGVTRTMEDTMLVGRDGLLHDFLGARRFLEVALRVSVSPEGWLRMRSLGSWLWIGRHRIPIPPVLSARVDLTERWDEASHRQRVDVTLTNPLVGPIFEYRGSFEFEPRGGALAEVDTTSIERRF